MTPTERAGIVVALVLYQLALSWTPASELAAELLAGAGRLANNTPSQLPTAPPWR